MKIFFENGQLLQREKMLSVFNTYFVVYCDAKDGYSKNKKFLDEYYEKYPEITIYTNSLVALNIRYSWNKDIEDVDVFMRENQDSEFKRISELQGGRIRPSQNIQAMFMSGCYGCL